jgi:hypothetical protein
VITESIKFDIFCEIVLVTVGERLFSKRARHFKPASIS